MKRRLIRFIRKSEALSRFFSRFLRFTKWSRSDDMKEARRILGGKYSEAEIRGMMNDMAYCSFRYGFFCREYALFELNTKSEQERAGYVSIGNRRRFNSKLNSSSDVWSVLRDKYQSYLTLKPFYKRDCIFVTGDEPTEEYLEFTSKHRTFAVKIPDSMGGKGFSKAELDPSDENAAVRFFEEHLKGGSFLLEELIRQVPGMAKFHPESVNTVRLITWYDNDTVKRVIATFRMGVGENAVDNAGSGGIFAEVDTDTGEIVSNARTEKSLEVFETHPDSGIRFIGEKLPEWDKLIAFAEEIARTIPGQKWVGWDLACTAQGWAVVEANHSPTLILTQMCRGEGVRELLRSVTGVDAGFDA